MGLIAGRRHYRDSKGRTVIEVRKLVKSKDRTFEVEIGILDTFYATTVTIKPEGGIVAEDWLRNFLFMQHKIGMFGRDLTQVDAGESLEMPRRYGPVDAQRAKGMLIDLKVGMDSLAVSKKYRQG